MAFLAIDIGNTRLKWALYASAQPGAAVQAHGAEFLENIDKLADGSWQALPPPQRMLGCCVAADAVKRWVDGNESDLEELTLRWRLAGVRWPIVILLALTFVAGYQAGRRARG